VDLFLLFFVSNLIMSFVEHLTEAMLQVDVYLLPQSAFPTRGVYFKNKIWVKETKGKRVIIHNNYITGFEKKIKRFRDHGLWLVDEHSDESPLGRI
jgi:rhamnogalacturonan II specific xylosyltransferase